MSNQTNVNEVWGAPPVKSVHSLQDLNKLVQPQGVQEVKEVKEEVKPTPKEYSVRGAAWGTQRAKVQAALAYAKKHPEVKSSEVARQFGIKLQTLYSAKYKAKLKVHSKLEKARAVKAEKQWKQSHASASTKPLIERDEEGYRIIEVGGRRARMLADRVVPKEDVVNHPAHYKAGGIETIDFIEAKQLTYNLGNVVKYITRAGIKNKATHIEDLEKAAWYLNREIQNLKK